MRPLPLAASAALATLAAVGPLAAQAPADSTPAGAARAAALAPAAPPPAALAPPSVPAWPAPGARVRVTFAAPSEIRLWPTISVAPQTPLEGRLVALDGAALTVDAPLAGQLTLPAGVVRRLEVRSRPGACRRGPAARTGCAVVGGAALLAAGLGVMQLADGEGRGGRSAGAGLLGGGLAVWFIGRRAVGPRWEPVRGWPPPAARETATPAR